MFRRFLRKLIPTYAIMPLVMTGVMNVLAFYGTRVIRDLLGMTYMMDMTTSFDRAIPFLPVWVIAYIGTYLFWTYQNIKVAQECEAMAYRLVSADFTAKVICFVIFLVLPTTNVRPELREGSLWASLLGIIWKMDSPTNLFPSIHCFVAWLGTRLIFDCNKFKRKSLVCILCVIGSILVFLSTLFTYQHVVYDVIGGVVVAEIGYLVGKYSPLPKLFEKLNHKFMKTKLAKIL